MKTVRIGIPETNCPDCKQRASWDAVGDITDNSVTITGWCSHCRNHFDIKIVRRIRCKPKSKE